MALTIQWTAGAVQDRRQIFQFYSQRNGTPDYSRNLARQFKIILNLVAQQNMMGLATSDPRVRYVLILDYSLFYSINGEIIRVLGIWDNRRAPDLRPF